eukprot:6386830-Amphidinium_carterae.2
MERGSAVGTAGCKLETADDNSEYIGTWPWIGKTNQTTLDIDEKYLRGTHGGSSETVLVHVSERTARGVLRAPADSDWAGCHNTRRSASCAASEAVYVKELLKFIGEETHIQLELDASSAMSMGSRVGLAKARHVAVRYLWLQQFVAEKAIKLVKVKGTQHPPDVGTRYLSKQGMLHSKSMLVLMELESLVPFGYKVEESAEGRVYP